MVAPTGTIIRGASWLATGQAISRGLKFLLFLIVVNVMSISGYGTFVYALATLSIPFIIGGSLHVLSPIHHEIASSPGQEHETLGKHLVFRCVFGAVAAAVGINIFVIILQGSLVMAMILGLSLMLDYIRDVFGTYLQSKEVMRYESQSIIAQAVVLIAVSTVGIAIDPSPNMLAWGYLAGSIAGWATVVWFTRKTIVISAALRHGLLLRGSGIRSLVVSGLGFGISWALVVSFPLQWAIVLIGSHFGSAAAGSMGIFFQILQIALVPSIAIGSASITPLAQARRITESVFRARVRTFFRTSLALAVAVMAGLGIVQKFLLPRLIPDMFKTDMGVWMVVMAGGLSIGIMFLYFLLGSGIWKKTVAVLAGCTGGYIVSTFIVPMAQPKGLMWLLTLFLLVQVVALGILSFQELKKQNIKI